MDKNTGAFSNFRECSCNRIGRYFMYFIPQPQEVLEKKGQCYLPYDGKIVIDGNCGREIYPLAQLLGKEIERYTGFTYEITKGYGKGTIYLVEDSSYKEEQYQISIDEERIHIKGRGRTGILYGIQTLRQIISQEGGVLPCMVIEDYPDQEVRGFYHDVTRGRVPTLDWLKELADTLSYYKINQMQLYIEHSYLFEGLSEVWRDDTPLKAEEILELDQYCLERGIELVPSLSTFGHLYKILSTKQFSHLSETKDAEKHPFSFVDRMAHYTIDVSSEEGFQLIEKLLLEYMPLFTSKKFNLGADETFDLGKGRNKERAKKEGIPALYMEYVGKLCSFVVEKGYTPLIWGDVMLEFPELATKLPKGTICLNWGYAPWQTEDSTRTYAEHGVKQYVCPGVGGWNQLINIMESAYNNISRMCGYAKKYEAAGVLNTDWGDYGHINHPAFSIPGLIYGGAASWNYDGFPEYEDINKAISKIEYKDSTEKFMEIVGMISKQESFSWRNMVQWKEKYHDQPEEKRKEFLKEAKEQGLEEAVANQTIVHGMKELTACISSMDTSSRSKVKPYLLAAEGMILFNQLGTILQEEGSGEPVKEQGYILAEKLEQWFYRYRMMWYTVSKESELYRLREVMQWYGDYLRE